MTTTDLVYIRNEERKAAKELADKINRDWDKVTRKFRYDLAVIGFFSGIAILNYCIIAGLL